MLGEKKSVNLRTVANRVGLAPCSVSAVLNDTPAAKAIPQATKDRVFRAAAELNYRPNLWARSLRTKRTRMVAAVTADFGRRRVAEVVAGARKFFKDTDKDNKGMLDEAQIAAGINAIVPRPKGFPAPPPGDPAAPAHVGDIAIACETVIREAQEQGLSVSHHLAHLSVHGFLHLLGYDHGTDGEAERMEQLEREILASLGIPDPYAVRDA